MTGVELGCGAGACWLIPGSIPLGGLMIPFDLLSLSLRFPPAFAVGGLTLPGFCFSGMTLFVAVGAGGDCAQADGIAAAPTMTPSDAIIDDNCLHMANPH